MTSAAGAVRVYRRPACPSCAMLRLALQSARVRGEWVNIWEEPTVAAAVRTITGGDETVPTLVVGTTAMVNPSARRVIAAVRARSIPAEGDPPRSWFARGVSFLRHRWLRPRRAVDDG